MTRMRLDPEETKRQPGGFLAAEAGSRVRRASQRGSEIVEFSLVFLPMMAFLFLILDIGWAIFARSMLQNAVREGVRYAVTSQVRGGMGHKDSIKTAVQEASGGILRGNRGLDAIHVRFYSPDTFTEISGVPGANAGGNLVEVSVEGFAWAPMAPLMRNGSALSFTARSMDRMEAAPSTGPPAL
jgi:hypothetical protein